MGAIPGNGLVFSTQITRPPSKPPPENRTGCALQAHLLHVVRAYDMRGCYVVNAAPKAKANKCVLGKKKILDGLLIDREQVRSRAKAPSKIIERKRQSDRNYYERKKQCKQADVAAATT